MTGAQFKAAIAALDLTQEGAAEFLEISLRACNGYANGAPIPASVVMLLRLMVKRRIKPETVK